MHENCRYTTMIKTFKKREVTIATPLFNFRSYAPTSRYCDLLIRITENIMLLRQHHFQKQALLQQEDRLWLV